jgi:hypothetical protein
MLCSVRAVKEEVARGKAVTEVVSGSHGTAPGWRPGLGPAAPKRISSPGVEWDQRVGLGEKLGLTVRLRDDWETVENLVWARESKSGDEGKGEKEPKGRVVAEMLRQWIGGVVARETKEKQKRRDQQAGEVTGKFNEETEVGKRVSEILMRVWWGKEWDFLWPGGVAICVTFEFLINSIVSNFPSTLHCLIKLLV